MKTPLQEVIYGHTAVSYHRTQELKHLKGIIYKGFSTSKEGMYGSGLYSTYSLESQFTSYMSRYGKFVLAFKTNLKDFLIFDEDEAKKVYGDKFGLRDQLNHLGILPAIKKLSNSKYATVYEEDLEILLGKTDVFIKIKNQNKPFKIRQGSNAHFYYPTDDASLTFIPKKNIDNDTPIQLIIDKKVAIDTTINSIESIYVLRPEKKSTYEQEIEDIITKHENHTYDVTSDIAHAYYKIFKGGINQDIYYKAKGVIYTGRHDGQCLVSFVPKENTIPFKVAYAPWFNTSKMNEVKFVKTNKAYISRYVGVIMLGMNSADYIKDPTMESSKNEVSNKLNEDAFTLDSMQQVDQDRFYDLFQKSYEKATGNSWSKGQFMGKAHNWTFYGDKNGGVAVRIQHSGLIKLVAAFGSPRSIISGMKELINTKGNEPIWTAADKNLVDHLVHSLGFHIPPKFVLKLLAPQIGKAMGGHIKSITNDGAIEVESQFGTLIKYFAGNKAYFKWLIVNLPKSGMKIPGLIVKWVSTLIGK